MELWLETTPFNGLLNDGWHRFFTEGSGSDRPIVPSADLLEDSESYRLHLEMPGLEPDSIEVRFEEDWLVVEAERKRPEWAKDAEIHIAERRYGALRRGFRLPEGANRDGIKASYRDGVLEVAVPKRPERKPVRIKVEHLN